MSDNVISVLAEEFRAELQNIPDWIVQLEGSHIFLMYKELPVVRILCTDKMDYTGYHVIGKRVLVDVWSWPITSTRPPRASSFGPNRTTNIVRRAMMIMKSYEGVIDD